MPAYSIIIPAYNESRRIVPTLDRVLQYVAEQAWDAEIVVVNDGSKDDTAAIIRRYMEQHPRVRLIENPGNRGKGYSVRNGMLNARGRILLMTDADLSSPIEEADKLIAAIRSGHDVAIGSRWLNPSLQKQRQPLYRQFFGRAFNLTLRALLGVPFRDTQCGFKAFTREAADRIFPRQRIERWGFDPEIVFLAQRSGLKVKEVPVVWSHDEGTKLNYFRDGLRMVQELLRIRWYSMRGDYAEQPHPAPKAA